MCRVLLKAFITVILVGGIASRGDAIAQPSDPPSAPSDGSSSTPSEKNIFRKLFVTLGRDVKQLPSRENASVLVAGGLLALGVYPSDKEVTAIASSSKLLKATFSGWGKAIGREWVQGGGALAAYVAGSLGHKPRMAEAGGDLIEAQLVALTVTQGLKFAFSRERPDREARSFPSGHASAAFATARVLQRHFGTKAALPAYAVAIYTSSSRLQANSHYASDVIVGAALGVAIGQTATRGLHSSRLTIMPVAVRDGFQVVVAVR